MADVIEFNNESYIRAGSPLIDLGTRVLMRGDLFGVFDWCGDFRVVGFGGQGLFFNDSRHLSKWVLRLENDALVLLSSTVTLDNARLSVDLTNPDLELQDGRRLPRHTVHFQRTKFLPENECRE